MTLDNAIEIRGLTKHFQDFTLDNITFNLPNGCILGVIGENGAGKSTLIRLIMNALQKDAGFVRVLGEDNESPDFAKVKEDIGIVLDELSFPMVLTVKDVNKMMKYTYRRWDEAVFAEYVRKFRLPEGKAFKEFSRGMKMKLAIAVALSHHAKLLILDEATGGLDPIARDEILEIFYDFTREPDHSILISSHILSDLEKLCDYIAFVQNGRMLFCREKDLLLEEYGVLRCSRKEAGDVPEKAVFGRRESQYGAELLVKRSLLNPAFAVEPAAIEDIILFMAKGDAEC